ncbi:hypothetical protein ABIC71_000941 [Herbaspirillum seropedicae]|uniref:calcium-binding protein n=1 Tax=Herbaspirillum seropedicae TaxID=964 RepID=UPI0033974744
MTTPNSTKAQTAASTTPPELVITRINDRFVSIKRGSVSEVVFSPIHPGIKLFGDTPPASASQPVAANPVSPGKADVAVTPVLDKPVKASPAPSAAALPVTSTPAATPAPVISKAPSVTPSSTSAPAAAVVAAPAASPPPVTPAVAAAPVTSPPPVTPNPVIIHAPSITPASTSSPGAAAPVTSTPSVTPAPVVSKAPSVAPTRISAPPAAATPVASTPATGAPAGSNAATATASTPPAAPAIDLVAQANAARYLETFNAPAPFGDEDAKPKKSKQVAVQKNLSLDEDTDDLSLGSSLNGIGNALDNRLTGNDQNNILDGMGGADTLIGGKGDDSYYVNNAGDKVVEQAGEGVDTLYATVGTTLSANVENLVLLDASKPQSAVVNGVNVLVYGMPRSYQLDYDQGGEVEGYWGTCGETSVANVTLMGGHAVSEKEVVERAIKENLCDTAAESADTRGATSEDDRQALLQDFGFAASIDEEVDLKAVAQSIKDGKGVVISVSASKLWDLHEENEDASDHAITVTGVACSAASGKIVGFYIADSGRGLASDMCRFVSLQRLREATNVYGADTVTTDDPIKLRNQNLDATGNELDNILVGNRGNNTLTGGKGNDLLIGGAGNDTYAFAKGDGQDVLYDHDATKGNLDTLRFSDAKQNNLWLSKAGNDLRIDVLGTTDQVLVKDWYVGGDSGSDNHVERIKTADGKTLYDSDVDKLVQAMASFAPPAATQTRWPETAGGHGKVLLTISH